MCRVFQWFDWKTSRWMKYAIPTWTTSDLEVSFLVGSYIRCLLFFLLVWRKKFSRISNDMCVLRKPLLFWFSEFKMTSFNNINKSMASVYSSHNSASTRWLARAIQMLLEDTWPTDRTISFDGSGFPLDTQDAANNVFFEAVRKNGKVKSIRLRNQNLSLKAQTTFQNILSSNSNLRRLEFCNVSTSDSSELLLNTSFSSSNVQELLLQKCIINK